MCFDLIGVRTAEDNDVFYPGWAEELQRVVQQRDIHQGQQRLKNKNHTNSSIERHPIGATDVQFNRVTFRSLLEVSRLGGYPPLSWTGTRCGGYLPPVATTTRSREVGNRWYTSYWNGFFFNIEISISSVRGRGRSPLNLFKILREWDLVLSITSGNSIKTTNFYQLVCRNIKNRLWWECILMTGKRMRSLAAVSTYINYCINLN